MKEKFEAGYPRGVTSLMAGEIVYGESYENVGPKLAQLENGQGLALKLLVVCDRVYGFFETRGGIRNGERLVKLIRDLAGELGMAVGVTDDVTNQEAKGYYDQLVVMGALELAESIGARDVFCTVWGTINDSVSLTR